MTIDIVCTFSATTIEAEATSISLVLTLPVTQLPSNICDDVKDCLGIDTINGEVDEFLNKRGQWVEISGGSVDSVNGQTGVVELDADDIDETATRFWLTDVLKSAYDSAVTWISTNGSNLLNHLSNTSNPHNTTAAQVGAPSGSGTSTGTNTGDQDLSGLQGKRIVVSSSQTATNDSDYTLVASATFTDPTPIEGKGYSVLIRNGTATIGALAYSTVGTLVWRLFHSGSWATYVLTNQTQLDLKQDKPITIKLSGDVTTTSASSTAITGLVATLEANTNYIITGVLRSRCSGAGGVKYGMTLVSGATSTISAQGKGALSGSTVPLEEYYFSQAGALTTTGLIRLAGGASDIYLNGNINVGATAGTIQLNFASATGGQTSTIAQFGTWIEIKKA